MQTDLFAVAAPIPPQQFESEPFLTIEIPGRLPSWNEILAMEHWARDKFKTSLRQKFLSALRVFVQDSSTKTTCAKNIISTAADTLDSYDKMIRQRRKSRAAKRRLEKASLNLLELKSSPPEKLPF